METRALAALQNAAAPALSDESFEIPLIYPSCRDALGTPVPPNPYPNPIPTPVAPENHDPAAGG